jgi:ABC-type oligopeptide transport system substrate-binding subunit
VLASAYAAEKCSGDYSKCPAIYFAIEGSIRETVGQPTVDQWRQAFPGWEIQTGPFPHMELKAFGYLQLALDGWTQDYPDPQDFLSLLWTTGVDNNLSHVSMPQVDTLLAQADGMGDQAARIPLYQQAEQLLVNQGAAIPLTQDVTWYAVRSRVVGWRIAPSDITPLTVWQQVYIKR